MLFDEDQDFTRQISILQQDSLSQRSQWMRLQHVLAVARHGQVVNELHVGEDKVEDLER